MDARFIYGRGRCTRNERRVVHTLARATGRFRQEQARFEKIVKASGARAD